MALDDDILARLHDAERVSRENSVAIERAAADAKHAREMAQEMRPIFLERSRDLLRFDRFEIDNRSAHDKIRSHSERIDKLEDWVRRFIWIGAGIVIAMNLVAWFIEKIVLK